MVLRELIRTNPVVARRCAQLKTDAPSDGSKETDAIAAFWPEGFLYVNFCLSAMVAVEEQEFGEARSLGERALNLQLWWSFRENVQEDANLAIPFLDRMLGLEPNWTFPTSVGLRGDPAGDYQHKSAGYVGARQ